MGTSHMISQSFAKAFNMVFQDREGKQAHPYLTSWGATTRLIGAVVMMHGDEKGLVLPPNIAPIQVVIVPIFKKGVDNQVIIQAAERIAAALKDVRVHIDADDTKTPGAKFYTWELKGVPVRIEIGPRDIEQQHVMISDRLGMGKQAVAFDGVAAHVATLLERVQNELFERARIRIKTMWHKAARLSDFGPQLQEANGLYQTGWCRDRACELLLKEYQATTRCLLEEKTFPNCFACDKPSKSDVLIAKAY
jgi:prolyl-tRNA synthetase